MLNFVRPDQVATAVAIYRPYWNATMLQDVAALPGALDLLRALHARGAQLAIFTNKHGPSSRLIADHLGFSPFLHANLGAQDTAWLKPDPAFTAHLLAQLGAEAATTLMVGDSPFDVQAALNAGFPCWAVTTGTHTATELTAAGALTTSNFRARNDTTMSRRNAASAAIRQRMLATKITTISTANSRSITASTKITITSTHASNMLSPAHITARCTSRARRHKISSCDSKWTRSSLASAAAVRTCPANARVRSTTRAMRLVSVIMSPPTPLNKITGVIAN